VTVNWGTICNPKSEGGLQVVNFQLENKAYPLRLAWDFAYNYRPWISLMKARFLKSKYQRVGSFFSSSIWPGINDWYDTILEHTFWIVGRGDNINFWNDLWCYEKCISLLARVSYAKRIKLKATMTQGWKDSDSWDLSPSFLNIQGLHNLCYISLTSWEDTPNWMLEDSGSLT